MIDVLRRGLDDPAQRAGLAQALAGCGPDGPDDDIERLADAAWDVIRRMPDAIEMALAMSKDPQCGRAVSFAIGSILTYVFDPDDLLPEREHGPLGLIDDAYLVHAFVGRLSSAYPAVAADTGRTSPDSAAIGVVAALLPDGLAHALDRTAESVLSVAQALLGSGGGGPAPADPPVVTVRVTDALAALAAR